MMFRIVSHTRTGTHYLAELLFRNFRTGAKAREELHFSHSRIPTADGEVLPYIHLHRKLLPTLLSMWRCRDHLGLDPSVSFSSMLRVPWSQLPKASSCQAYFDGDRCDRVCPPREFGGTVLHRWQRLVPQFEQHCTVSVPYEIAVARPKYVLGMIATAFSEVLLGGVVPVLERVGWWPAHGSPVEVTSKDLSLIEEVQCQYLLSSDTVRLP